MQIRSRASIELNAWTESKGGLRAGARELGIHHNTLSRWLKGEQVPRDDGPTSKDWIEEKTGVAADGWDVLVKTDVPPPRQDQPPKASNLRHLPASGAARTAARAVEPPPSASPAPRRAPAAATVAALQERLRAIPAELAELRENVVDGDVKVPQAECLRRLLEGEAKSLASAITAAGLASVAEVEALEGLVLSCTASCEACRARVEDALREIRSS